MLNVNIAMLYKDILDIIYDYKELLEIHEKKQKVLLQIKCIERYEIAVCRHCRTVKVRDFLYADNENCNHYFYLVKPIFMINYDNNNKLLQPYMFNFYCLICNKYEFFYNHLNH